MADQSEAKAYVVQGLIENSWLGHSDALTWDDLKQIAATAVARYRLFVDENDNQGDDADPVDELLRLRGVEQNVTELMYEAEVTDPYDRTGPKVSALEAFCRLNHHARAERDGLSRSA